MKKNLAITLTIAAAAILTFAAGAAGLSKYKDWANSPEAYFLSAEERAKWAGVSSDEDAEKFIADYRAARGGGFAAAIKSRIDYADKTFALGKKKGSETLRGRTLIVLGPPTRVVQGTSSSGATKADPTGGDVVTQGGGGDKGPGSVGNAYSNAGGPGGDSLRAMTPTKRTVTSTWIYDDRSVPPTVKEKELRLEFMVDPDERTEEAKDRAKLDQLIGSVVEYWKPKK